MDAREAADEMEVEDTVIGGGCQAVEEASFWGEWVHVGCAGEAGVKGLNDAVAGGVESVGILGRRVANGGDEEG